MLLIVASVTASGRLSRASATGIAGWMEVGAKEINLVVLSLVSSNRITDTWRVSNQHCAGMVSYLRATARLIGFWISDIIISVS